MTIAKYIVLTQDKKEVRFFACGIINSDGAFTGIMHDFVGGGSYQEALVLLDEWLPETDSDGELLDWDSQVDFFDKISPISVSEIEDELLKFIDYNTSAFNYMPLEKALSFFDDRVLIDNMSLKVPFGLGNTSFVDGYEIEGTLKCDNFEDYRKVRAIGFDEILENRVTEISFILSLSLEETGLVRRKEIINKTPVDGTIKIHKLTYRIKICGIEDTLKPLDDYIAEIKESDEYLYASKLYSMSKKDLVSMIASFEHYPAVTIDDDLDYILAYLNDEGCPLSRAEIINYEVVKKEETQYTKKQIHSAMKRFANVDYDHREYINGKDCFIYNSKDSNFKMIVDLATGFFSGYELDTKAIVPPLGAIQSIKGMSC